MSRKTEYGISICHIEPQYSLPTIYSTKQEAIDAEKHYDIISATEPFIADGIWYIKTIEGKQVCITARNIVAIEWELIRSII